MAASSFANRLAVSTTFLASPPGCRRRSGLASGPLSGSLRSWGLPGLYGCQIWVEWLNRKGA